MVLEIASGCGFPIAENIFYLVGIILIAKMPLPCPNSRPDRHASITRIFSFPSKLTFTGVKSGKFIPWTMTYW